MEEWTLEHSPRSQALPSGLGPAVDFIGEGMANMVFSFPQARDEMRGVLLRVPKEVTGEYGPIHRNWCEHVWPLFRPRDLVPQVLVAVDDADDPDSRRVLEGIRAAVARAEEDKRREPRFLGSEIKSSFRDAMLVADMRPQNAREFLIEFKPKWLAQSPTAPEGSKRCRNCAREALRNNRRKTDDAILCPLRLLDRDSPLSVELVTQSLTQGRPTEDGLAAQSGSVQAHNLALWLRSNDLLPRLRDAQTASDGAGVLDPPDAFSLGVAMTLRDCTCYVRVSGELRARDADEIEARLGDLDLKNRETKLAYWRDMELELIREGYYHATEEPRQETRCKLQDE